MGGAADSRPRVADRMALPGSHQGPIDYLDLSCNGSSKWQHTLIAALGDTVPSLAPAVLERIVFIIYRVYYRLRALVVWSVD